MKKKGNSSISKSIYLLNPCLFEPNFIEVPFTPVFHHPILYFSLQTDLKKKKPILNFRLKFLKQKCLKNLSTSLALLMLIHRKISLKIHENNYWYNFLTYQYTLNDSKLEESPQ